MYFLLGVCENPGLLKIIYFIFVILDIIFTFVPIILIMMLLFDLSKGLFSGEDISSSKDIRNFGSRIMSSVLLFLVPWIIQVFLIIIGRIGFTSEYSNCLTVALSGNFTKYDEAYNKEKEEEANERTIEIDRNREEALAKINERKIQVRTYTSLAGDTESDDTEDGGTGTVNITGSSPNKNYQKGKGSTVSGEPESPLTPLNNLYKNSNNEMYNPKNFIAMKDKNTGASLGAWPKNANVSNLSGKLTTYQNGILIYPVTGNGYISYNHNGIDIVTDKIGTPIYAPADGTLVYSEWGHTINRGARETAYSVTIKLDKPFKYNGTWSNSLVQDNVGVKMSDTVTTIFMTHMVGIKNRLARGSGIHVSQGELIGFNGVAADVSHVHITYYNESQSYGLHTDSIRKIYKLKESVVKEAGH